LHHSQQAVANGIRGTRKPKSACADWRKIKGFETCVVRYAQRKRFLAGFVCVAAVSTALLRMVQDLSRGNNSQLRQDQSFVEGKINTDILSTFLHELLSQSWLPGT
jgi:hypothetical protein